MSDLSEKPFWGVIGFTIFALCSILALFAVCFRTGLGLMDESLFVYLMAVPRTVEACMDQVVWGQLLAPFPWTIVHLRWLAVIGTTLSASLLMAAAFRWMGPLFARRSDTLLSYAVALAMSLFGALFYFTTIRPTFHYSTTLVMMPCLFVAAMLWRQTLSGRASRFLALMIMAVCFAMNYLAKPTTPIFLLFVFVGFQRIEGGKFREIAATLGSLVVAAVALLALAIPIGYDPAGQLLLLNAAAGSSHNPMHLAGDAMYYGGMVFVGAVCCTVAFAYLSRTNEAKDRYGRWLLIGLYVLATGILARDAFRGRYSPTTEIYARNLAGPLQVFVLVLVLDRFAPILSARWRALQRLFPPRAATTDDRRLAALALVLYGACFSGILGTNTGLWTRSIMSMGPLLLLSAVFLVRRFKEGRIDQWTLSALVVPFYLLLFPPLYVNQYLRPTWIEAVPKETVRLDHPAVLRGLWVTPEIARLQVRLEQKLRPIAYDPISDRLLPGNYRTGLVLLAGGKSLGPPWMTSSYPNSDRWNCAVIRLGLRQSPRRIIAFDLGTLGQGTFDCLSVYGPVGVVAHKSSFGKLTVITPYDSIRRKAADKDALETED